MIVSSASPLRADRLGVAALEVVERGVQQQLGHADDAVHRRADLVAHVGQELALGTVAAIASSRRTTQFVLGVLAGRDVLDLGDEMERAPFAPNQETVSTTQTMWPPLWKYRFSIW